MNIDEKNKTIIDAYVREIKNKYKYETWDDIQKAMEREIFHKDILNFHIIPDSD